MDSSVSMPTLMPTVDALSCLWILLLLVPVLPMLPTPSLGLEILERTRLPLDPISTSIILLFPFALRLMDSVCGLIPELLHLFPILLSEVQTLYRVLSLRFFLMQETLIPQIPGNNGVVSLP